MSKIPHLLFCFLVFPVVLSYVGEQWVMSHSTEVEVTAESWSWLEVAFLMAMEQQRSETLDRDNKLIFEHLDRQRGMAHQIIAGKLTLSEAMASWSESPLISSLSE